MAPKTEVKVSLDPDTVRAVDDLTRNRSEWIREAVHERLEGQDDD